MKRAFWFCVAVSLCLSSSFAQQSSTASAANAAVPTLVNFSGTLTDVSGKPLTGTIGVTFYLYKDEQGGAPLWLETQNVHPDRNGHYTVMLGSTRSTGLPSDIFVAGQARWLSVQPQGQKELPRVMLLSVPYALKAGDAQTIAGLPPSAFVLAAPSPIAPTNPTGSSSSPTVPPPASTVTTSGGTVNALPLWTTATNIQSSVVTQSGSGSTAKIGINTATPTNTLDVKGTAIIRGPFALPATGVATATTGKNSQPESFIASTFSSATHAPVAQTFRWQAESALNNTSTPGGTLNLLYGLGSATPAETGLRIGPKGIIGFASGQTFPGTGSVKSVALTAPSADFTVSGSPVTTTGILALAWKVAPTSTDTANAIVKRDASGSFTATTISASAVGVSSSGSIAGDFLTNASGGTGVVGEATNTSGTSIGVYGLTDSNDATSSGVAGYNNSFGGGPGVYGYSNGGGVGVYGAFVQPSSISSTFFSGFAGMWGDGGPQADGGSYGVMGTIDSGIAGLFANNSGVDEALEALNYNSNGFPLAVYNMYHSSFCTVDSAGDLNCSGTKNAIVPLDGGARKVAMSAIEAPQNWFEDAGSAKLTNGSAVVALDPDYMQTVNTEKEYQVFLTPYGDCKGLYVTNRTARSFEVHELGGGTASLSFGYRIMALRKKYETVRFADHTNDPDPIKRARELAKKRAQRQARPVGARPISLLVK
jgi:hypothetical protein